jgi:predicted dehydrogenase
LPRQLGVAVVGVGWCGAQHVKAFLHNRMVEVRLLCGRDEARARDRLATQGVDVPAARFTRRFADVLAAPDVDIVSIATPNHLHASQAVAAARAGKHVLLEKPTGLDPSELTRIRDAVRRARVRTIVSFELRYHPYLQLAHWLRASGRLGEIRFARCQYLSRVTDWYSGWSWVRTTRSGRSHLLAAGCHAVDALRWCTGLEVSEVSAYHTRITAGYQWPTSIVANLRLRAPNRRRPGPALGQLVSSTDFMMPYAFGVELMGDRATLRDDILLWNDTPIDLDDLRRACPIAYASFVSHELPTGAAAIRLVCPMPGSADVSHHPFQGEIDELVTCILEDRETSISVFDAQKTMEVCLAADRSAERGGRPVTLPLGEG